MRKRAVGRGVRGVTENKYGWVGTNSYTYCDKGAEHSVPLMRHALLDVLVMLKIVRTSLQHEERR